MKGQNEKTEKKSARSYFYAVLGCIAVLLAAAIVITAIAISGKKQNVVEVRPTSNVASSPERSLELEPVTKSEQLRVALKEARTFSNSFTC